MARRNKLGDKLRRLLRRPVNFDDLSRTKPIGKVFGFDRGMPIDRYYIEKFISKHRDRMKGRTLEVGDYEYTKKFGGAQIDKVEVINPVPDNPITTIVGDLSDISTLPANIIDCFICTQTLHLIYDYNKSIEGIYHMLKPGGVVLVTVPGISQICHISMQRWGDYWRFTTASLEKLFEDNFEGTIEIEQYGNVLAATALLQGIAVEDLPDQHLLDEVDPLYPVIIGVVAQKKR